MTTTSTLDALRKKAEKSAKIAEGDKAALLEAAVEEAIQSTKYGHLSKVARSAGITSQYLRTLVEEAHPGWLDRAAAEREAAKAAAKATKGKSARAA
ncbi:hypothetical protein AB0B15_38445 [Streptomyces sp. NPDC045456]|uniref:hypothetical protein n=1 Tax=Streptomyces sp. NPDC045456 TaxID=3155254 RepID=UPI0033EFB891